jgi:ribosomal protein S12 methylthiotransferase accessory factor
MERPQFKAHFQTVAVEGDGLFVLSEREPAMLLRGRLYERLAPLLDGQRSVAELIARLRGQMSAAEVYYTLGQLEHKGYLVEGHAARDREASCPAHEAVFWSAHGLDPGQAVGRLAATRVAVTTVGEVEVGPLLEVLGHLGVSVGEPAQLAVVVSDHYLRSALQSINTTALASGRPWLLVRPVGSQIWLGPLLRPGQSGCWACMAYRLRANRQLEGYLQQRLGAVELPAPPAGSIAATVQTAWGLTAQAIAAWLAHGELPELEGQVVTLDLHTFRTQSHPFTRLPQCPACGQPPRGNGQGTPVVLTSRMKTFTSDGGHRVAAPEETLQCYEHLVSPLTGVVPRLARTDAVSDGVVHVYDSGYNPARLAGDLARLRRDLRSGSSGKGISDVQAKASALCEALERHSGVFRGDEPRRRARLVDLDEAAIYPNACMLYSDRQFAERAAHNARPSTFNWIPRPFDPDAEIEWTPLWSLTRQAVRYLPTAFCYYAYPEPHEHATCHACSNGNAAGNTIEEAILQGFFELVERDGVALWWYNRVRRPAVDLGSFGEPYLEQLTAYLGTRDRELWALDLTSDMQIPTFAALSRRTDAPERILFGFGAHLDPRIALLRAVTELNQMLVWVLPAETAPEPDRAVALEDEEILHWLQTATLSNQPYLAPDSATAPRRLADYPRHWTDDLRDDVLLCQRRVEQFGMEMLVLDQTRPDIGLPVVKVVVPGLRHFWARFAPGRLYDVPVHLGWLERPLPEDAFNPTAMFL